EQPIFSTRAHVFQIDPVTKKNWIPASKHAATVSYFYDATRNVYRVISVGGTKAIINSTITPNMTFTKTSQKFGQWADSRANTVYGLGFASEQNLSQFAEKFQEVREAARLARERSQDKTELTNPALNITSQQIVPSPIISSNGPGDEKLFRSQSAEMELTTERERVKKMLSEGYIHQLTYTHVTELESQTTQEPNAEPGKDELGERLQDLEMLLKSKEEEILLLKGQKPDLMELESEREEMLQRLQEFEERNQGLEQQLQRAEQQLRDSVSERDRVQGEIGRAGEALDVKICELNDLRQGLARLLDSN
ncbi:hypothetical protein FKM82_015067, partial [Ascaphus truei]